MCLRSNGSRSPIPSFSYACTIYNNADAKKDSPCFQFFLNCMLPNHWQADPEKVLLLGLSMSWLSDWLSVGSVKAISLIRTCLLLHLPLLETALNRGEDPGLPSDQAFQTWRAVAEVDGLGKPPDKKSAVFFNIVQKAFDPTTPPFDWTLYGEFFWRNFNNCRQNNTQIYGKSVKFRLKFTQSYPLFGTSFLCLSLCC